MGRTVSSPTFACGRSPNSPTPGRFHLRLRPGRDDSPGRSRASRRRSASGPGPRRSRTGSSPIDFGQRRATAAARQIQLTTIELELLRVLSAAEGRGVATEALLQKVWGRRGSGDTDRMRTALKKLRAKLGDAAANPTYIFNEYGVGYRFARPGSG